MSPRVFRRRVTLERAGAEAQVDDELAFHRECTIRELMAAGLSREAAVREADRRFGPAAAYRARLVEIDLRRRLAEARRATVNIVLVSLRGVGRNLRRSPGFALGVVAILTLGLGVNAISYGLVDRLVLSAPAGIQSPDDLVRIVVHQRERSGAAIVRSDVGYMDYEDLRRAASLSGVAAESASALLFGSGESAERIQARLVTADYFPLLGVTAAIGRFFTIDESAQGNRLVVLSHAFWQRRFGGDASVLGQTLSIGSNRYAVVGVAPRQFTGTAVTRVDVWLPLEAAADELVSGGWRTNRGFRWMTLVARRSPGVTVQAAEAEASALHRRATAGTAAADPEARIELTSLNPARGATASSEPGIAALVGGVAVLVLLIALANVANLFLARSLRRRSILALQQALGGARWRLAAEQATEGAILAAIGTAIAVGLAWLGAPAVQRLLFPEIVWFENAVDLRLLIALGTGAVVGGGLAAALPMVRSTRRDDLAWLAHGAPRSTRFRTRTQTVMLIVQAALSVLLLVGAGLFVRSLAAAQAVDLGLDVDRLLVVSIRPSDTPARPDLLERLRAGAGMIPGVERTTIGEGTVPFVSSWAMRVAVPGIAAVPRVDDGGPYVLAVEPGYFETVGTGIVEGRPLLDADREGAARVAIVNATMARLYWPGESPLGRCLQIGSDTPPCTTVVGVARNTRRQQLLEGDSLLFYIPFAQAPDNLRGGGRLIIRTSGAGEAVHGRISEAVRRQALELDPTLRYVSARSLEDIVSPQLRSWRLGAGLFGTFGVLALVVAMIGLYSVLAFSVEGRRREMGIRGALGATAMSLLGLIVRDGLKVSLAGVAIGLMLAMWLSRLASDLLYGVRATDAGVFVTAALMLVAAAIAASAVPAWRASRTDPTTALRAE
jgi:predicted permease